MESANAMRGNPERARRGSSARALWRSPLGTRIAEGKRARATRPENSVSTLHL